MKITDKAVQVFINTMHHSTANSYEQQVEQALTAALPHLSAIVTKPVDGSMTQEEFRLEDIKQMASYTGSIVSFETRDPYYLASCDCCGWVGSSELCGTDSFGDDSDVYCPRCHASGADSGMVAERISAKPVDVAAVRKQAFEEAAKITDEFIANYIGGSSPEAMACFTVSRRIGDYISALSAEPILKGQQHDK